MNNLLLASPDGMCLSESHTVRRLVSRDYSACAMQ